MDRYQQTEEAMRQWLREAYQAGILSGDAGELDLAALKAEARRKLSQTAEE